MKKDDLSSQKEEIRRLGLNAIKNYFEVDVKAFDPEIMKLIHKKADLALKFDRELNLSKRAVEMNYIRVFRMISEDRDELKKLIKKSLPHYLR